MPFSFPVVVATKPDVARSRRTLPGRASTIDRARPARYRCASDFVASVALTLECESETSERVVLFASEGGGVGRCRCAHPRLESVPRPTANRVDEGVARIDAAASLAFYNAV